MNAITINTEKTGHVSCWNCACLCEEKPNHVHTFVYGEIPKTELSVITTVYQCPNCLEETLDSQGREVKHAEICRNLGLLEPAMIIAIREKYGMSESLFCEVTKINKNRLTKWEQGLVVQTEMEDAYLRLLDFSENMEHLWDNSQIANKENYPEIKSKGV